MQCVVISSPPTSRHCVTILMSCAKLRNLEGCISIHNDIVKLGFLEVDPFVGSSLVDSYAKCGSIVRAQEVFDRLPRREVISWTALLSGYARLGYSSQAVCLFEQMQIEGISPNAYTYVCILKSCGNLGSIERVLELHKEMEKKRLLDGNDPFICSSLIDIYSKFGLLDKAQHLFNRFQVRDVASWTALISGYVEQDYGEEALHCFQQMQAEGVQPNIVSYVCAVKACSSVAAIDVGQEIHGEIERKGLFGKDAVVGNVLIDMYAKCGHVTLAEEVFDKLFVRDVISWTSLIAGYADRGCEEAALRCFEKMQCDGICPNSVTLVSCLRACSNLGAIDKIQELHGEIVGKGLLERDLFLANALIDVYAKHGLLVDAQRVFDELPARDVVGWTALIVGHTDYGHGKEAIRCFEQMQLDGVSPNVVTVVCALKACARIGAIHKGQLIHEAIQKHTLLERNLAVSNALIDMYAKCGLVNMARHVFNQLPIQDVVSWASLISGYAEHGREEEALSCYEAMQLDGVLPDAVIFMSVLRACGIIGATAKGIQIHAQIERQGLLELNLAVGNTLIDMYAKCGSPTRAQHVFDRLRVRDVVSWNALLAGYAQSGESYHVFHFFEKMLRQGIEPDMVSFLVVMCACSRKGLFHESKTYFEAMTVDYGVVPTIQHHSCMVDLLGRVGEVDKAVEMIKKMPFCPNLVVWHTVLGASRYWGSTSIGKQAFQEAVHLDRNDAVAYIMISHILASIEIEHYQPRIKSYSTKH